MKCRASILLLTHLGLALGGCARVVSPWQTDTTTDLMTDRKLQSIVTKAPDGFLSINCEKGRPEAMVVIVGAADYLGKRDAGPQAVVQHRFDKAPAIRSEAVYADHFVVSPNWGDSFRQRMAVAEVLTVRVWDNGGAARDFRFDVRGAKKAVGDLARRCGKRSN